MEMQGEFASYLDMLSPQAVGSSRPSNSWHTASGVEKLLLSGILRCPISHADLAWGLTEHPPPPPFIVETEKLVSQAWKSGCFA